MCGLSNPWLLLCDVRSRHSHVLHADCASALIKCGSPEERSPVHSSAAPFSFLRLLILSQAKQTNKKEYQLHVIGIKQSVRCLYHSVFFFVSCHFQFLISFMFKQGSVGGFENVFFRP